ncbi:MAG: GTPase HflX [Bacillota bacterium]
MVGRKEESVQELRGLAKTSGVISKKILYHNSLNIDPAYYISESKLKKLQEEICSSEINVIIFDNELTPAQHRNIEEELEIKIIDRTQLILDIFAQHAHTKESKIQVELAQLEYLLPRLKGKGEEMSRLAGGIGTRGPGESKLEVDRRRIEKKIHRLKKKLKKISKIRENQRKNRKDPLIALVGYTNAGKSTLMNLLTEAKTEVADKLFATLDSTLRSLTLPVGKKVVLSDTIGFINRLPHQLIASFQSSLEEIKNAELLLHVIDINQKDPESKIDVVKNVLKDMDIGNKNIIKVFNKCDLISKEKRQEMNLRYPESINISAQTGRGKDKLINKINSVIKKSMNNVNLKIPYDQANLVDEIYQQGTVFEEEYHKDHISIEALVSKQLANKLTPYRTKKQKTKSPFL